MKGQRLALKSELLDYIKYPDLFFTLAMGYKPHWFQIQILYDKHKKQHIRASRQGGKTVAVAVRTVWRSLTWQNYKVIITSPTTEQSFILFKIIVDLIERNRWVRKFLMYEPTKTSIYFEGGGFIKIFAKTATRGNTADELIIDEAAYLSDDKYLGAIPILAATEGTETLLSTPFGKQGRFFRSSLFESGYSVYHIPANIVPHLSKEFLKSMEDSMTKNEYLQEFMAEFIEDSDNYLPHNIIRSSIGDIPQLNEPDKDATASHYLGVDVARYGNDETVYTISRQIRGYDKIEVVYVHSEEKRPTTHTIGMIKELHKLWRFQGIYVDETSLGGGVVDSLVEGKIPVTPVTFNEKCKISSNPGDSNKEAMYKNLKWLMEKNADIVDWNIKNKNMAPKELILAIPNNKRLIQQLSELKFKYSEGNTLMVFHPEDSKAHNDFTDSLCLCLYKFIERRKDKGYYIA